MLNTWALRCRAPPCLSTYSIQSAVSWRGVRRRSCNKPEMCIALDLNLKEQQRQMESTLIDSILNFLVAAIDRFHMTSRRPYRCTKQWNDGYAGVQKKILIDSFSHVKKVPINLHSNWSREWQPPIGCIPFFRLAFILREVPLSQKLHWPYIHGELCGRKEKRNNTLVQR